MEKASGKIGTENDFDEKTCRLILAVTNVMGTEQQESLARPYEKTNTLEKLL